MAIGFAGSRAASFTRTTAGQRLPLRLAAPILVFAVAWWAPVAALPQAEWRTALLLVALFTAWTLEVAPASVIAVAFVAVYLMAQLGPLTVIAAGVMSPTWLLAAGFLVTAAVMRESTVLDRLVLRALRVLPQTFRASTMVLLLGGFLLTPFVPSIIGRCSLLGPLAVAVAKARGYADRSRSARGLGLAAFAGAALLGRGFLTGGTLNLIAMALLPSGARIGWSMWALAAAPATLTLLLGVCVTVCCGFTPDRHTEPLTSAVLDEKLSTLGPLQLVDTVSAVGAIGLLAALLWSTCLNVQITCGSGLGVLLAVAIIVIGRRRLVRQAPLLAFFAVILGLPAVMRHAGIQEQVTRLTRAAVAGLPHSATFGIVLVFLITVVVRFALSEWVAVPVLTVTFVPAADLLALHPWVIVFAVLTGANLWLLPYQNLSYAAFVGASDQRLFVHRQVRAFSAGYLGLSLLGLLVAIPFWQALGLVR